MSQLNGGLGWKIKAENTRILKTCLEPNINQFSITYSYLSIKRVYQLSIQGDIFEKKIKHVGKQST